MAAALFELKRTAPAKVGVCRQLGCQQSANLVGVCVCLWRGVCVCMWFRTLVFSPLLPCLTCACVCVCVCVQLVASLPGQPQQQHAQQQRHNPAPFRSEAQQQQLPDNSSSSSDDSSKESLQDSSSSSTPQHWRALMRAYLRLIDMLELQVRRLGLSKVCVPLGVSCVRVSCPTRCGLR